MLVPLVAILSASVQVTNATVDVSLASDGVTVSAEYGVSPDADELVLQAIRLPGQTITIVSSTETSSERVDGGLVQWATSPRNNAISIAYSVSGVEDRIPLIIPTHPTVPGETEIRIRIDGLSRDISLADGFPRMTRRDDGVVVAGPANLPSVILLPHGGAVSLSRTSDVVVLVLLALASGFWLVQRVRSRT